MPEKGIPSFGRRVSVLLDLVFALGEGELGFQDAIVICEGGTGDLLAVPAVAEDGAAIVAGAGVLDGAAEAGTRYCTDWAGF